MRESTELPVLRMLPTDSLVPHEDCDPSRVERLGQRIQKEKLLKNPPIVTEIPGSDRYVVLDGANRVMVFVELGIPHIVAQLVSYDDPGVRVDTWYHVRVCRSGDKVYLFLGDGITDSVLVGSGAYSTAPTAPGYTGQWRQYMGRAYVYDSTGPSHTLTYAQAEIDEFQFKVGALIYDNLTGFAPATDEVPAPELGVYTSTRGQVDELFDAMRGATLMGK